MFKYTQYNTNIIMYRSILCAQKKGTSHRITEEKTKNSFHRQNYINDISMTDGLNVT